MAAFDKQVPPIVDAGTDPGFGSSGFFLPGTAACFFFTFIDLTGQPYDPSNLDATITDADDEELLSSTELDKIELGYWAYSFTIPHDTTPGVYTLTLTYTVETFDGDESRTYTENFVIGEIGTAANAFTLRQIASRKYLESLVGETQRIPIFHETIRLNKARTIGKLSFPRWNQTAGTELLLNGEIMDSGYTVDYWNGRINFTRPMATFDEILASYNFRWFKDEELDAFITQGINEVNVYPPQTVYTINNIEERWLMVGIYAAAVNVIRRWMFAIQFAEPAKIFGSLDRAKDVFGQLETLKKNYEDNKTKLLEQKKHLPYIGRTKTITVPEYTLPGGRCLAFDSVLLLMVDNNEFTATVEAAYNLIHEENKPILVLSDNNGVRSFEVISKIWETGKKPLIKITDDNKNFIEVSEEHIVFIDGKEIPASEVKVGDSLTICMGSSIMSGFVTVIEKTEPKDTYDIEVPSTENLFVNNIKCHNSRWFRYLFKGNG